MLLMSQRRIIVTPEVTIGQTRVTQAETAAVTTPRAANVIIVGHNAAIYRTVHSGCAISTTAATNTTTTTAGTGTVTV